MKHLVSWLDVLFTTIANYLLNLYTLYMSICTHIACMHVYVCLLVCVVMHMCISVSTYISVSVCLSVCADVYVQWIAYVVREREWCLIHRLNICAHSITSCLVSIVACSSLVTEEPGRLPNSFVLTSCMTQPQAFWSRYAQTEIIEVRENV